MAYPIYQPLGNFAYQQPQYQPYQPLKFEQQPIQQASSSASVQPMPIPSQQASGIIMRPVTSRAEAVASQIQFDGSTSYFINTSNNEIYSKTFNFSDGTAPLVTYVREAEATPTVRYATIDDLNTLREELLTKPKKAVKKDDADE